MLPHREQIVGSNYPNIATIDLENTPENLVFKAITTLPTVLSNIFETTSQYRER
jgi:hypothetical protein